MPALPPVGSAELLERLSPYVPDQLVGALIPTRKGRGRRADFSPVQLFRTLLLGVLTPARSFNLLCRLLPDNRAWRRFALLPRGQSLPGPRMLHEFRQKLPPATCARSRPICSCRCSINLAQQRPWPSSTPPTFVPPPTLIKKQQRQVLCGSRRSGRTQFEVGPEPVVHRLQKTHPAAVAPAPDRSCRVGSADFMGCARFTW